MELTHKERIKVLWIIVVLVFAIILYLIGLNYFTTLSKSKEQVLDKLKAVTCTAALRFDTERHLHLTQSSSRRDDADSISVSEDYKILHELLVDVQEVNNLATPVHTMVYDSSYHVFQFIVTSAQTPYFRHDYIHFPKILVEKFSEGGMIDTYETENGTWLSAFSPLRLRNGKAIALLQADIEFGSFIAQARQELLKNTALALVIVIPLFFAVFFYTRKFLRQEEENESRLLKQQDAIVHQSNIIKRQSAKLMSINSQITSKNKALDIKVAERTKELQHSVDELNTFLYQSSHDIKSPLTTLLGLCHLNRVEGSDYNGYAKRIYDTSQHLAQRIKGLAEVYTIKNKKLVFESLPIGQFISEYLARTKVSDGRMHGKICYAGTSTSIILTDREILEIIIKEVLDNALCHHSNFCSPNIHINVEEHDDKIALTIQDNGDGMNEATLGKAFEMFYRGNSKSRGSGLGLYKVKLAADRLHHDISLYSIEGVGTTVSIQWKKQKSI